MKTLKQIREYLNEAKQVGKIYHFTKPSHLEKMLDPEYQKKFGVDPLHMMSRNGVISTTRSHDMPTRMEHYHDGDLSAKRGYSVRITLDGDKISNNHKIKPVLGLKNDEEDILDHKHNSNNRVSRHSGEAEEAVMKMPLNAKKYIHRIDFIHNSAKDSPEEKMDQERYEKIAKHLDSHGIEHSIGRKFHRINTLKEDIESDECFEIFI